MDLKRVAALALALVMAGSGVGRADLFDRAVGTLFTTEEQTRAVTKFPVNVSRAKDTFMVSTPCGSWSLSPQGVVQNLTEMLDPDRLKAALMAAIQNSIQNLVGAVVSKLSMLTVCYAVPTLCDLTKHMQAVSGQLHNIRALSCQQLEGMVNNVATSMVAGRTSRCIQGQIQSGMSLNVAQRVCASGEWEPSIAKHDPSAPGGGLGTWGDPGAGNPATAPGQAFGRDPTLGPLDPGHGTRGDQRIVEETLETAFARTTGSNPMSTAEQDELKLFAQQMIGDVLVEDDSTAPGAGGEEEPAKTKMTPELPEYRLHDYYESESEHMAELLACAVPAVGVLNASDTSFSGANCTVSYQPVDPTATPITKTYSGAGQILQALSVPGAGVPPQMLKALNHSLLMGDELQVAHTIGDLAGTMAMMRTVWRTYQLRDELEAGMMSKEDQTEEERNQVMIRIARLEREADRLVRSRELAERHFTPMVEEVLAEYEEAQARHLPRTANPGTNVDNPSCAL